jgi:hypothetical protein
MAVNFLLKEHLQGDRRLKQSKVKIYEYTRQVFTKGFVVIHK